MLKKLLLAAYVAVALAMPILGGLALASHDCAMRAECTTDAECAATPQCRADATCDGGPQ